PVSPRTPVGSYPTLSALPVVACRDRRSTLCCTFSRVTPGGCYPPFSPAEPGRSSARSACTRDATAHRPIPFFRLLLVDPHENRARARAEDYVIRCCSVKFHHLCRRERHIARFRDVASQAGCADSDLRACAFVECE